MGFTTKTWREPITIDALNMNRIEKGIKNAHDNLEILNEEVSNLQNKRIKIEDEIATILKTIKGVGTLTPSTPYSNYVSTLEQALTEQELKQVYTNLKLNNVLKLTDVRVNGDSIVTDSVLNIPMPTVDQSLDANSTNAISNKAVAEILSNFNPDIKVPTKLSDLLQDNDHLTVTAAEKAKWNAGGESSGGGSGGGISKETDPTVPDWAKEPVKPFYSYSEILGTPTKLSVFTNDMGFTTNDYVDSEITKLQNILLGPDGDAALDTINELASAIEDNSDIIETLNQAITNKAAKDHTHKESEITDLQNYSLSGHTHTKSEITDFTHTHTKSDITDFTHTHTKSDITDFTHTHDNYLPLTGGTMSGEIIGTSFTGVIRGRDTRNTNSTADEYFSLLKAAGEINEFKEVGAIGAPNGNSRGWVYLKTMSAWNDPSGGYPFQLSIGNGLAYRKATTGITWGEWKTVLDSSNISTYAATPSHTHSYLSTGGGTLTGNLNMSNCNITNINHIQIADSGADEGIEWIGGSNWKIYESNNALGNNAGNLQFVTGSTRRMTLDTSSNLYVLGAVHATSYYLD